MSAKCINVNNNSGSGIYTGKNHSFPSEDVKKIIQIIITK